MFFEKNSKYLSPKILKLIEKIEYEGKIEILESRKEKNITAKVQTMENNSILLHSLYSPMEEAVKFVKQFEKLGEEEIFIAGFGLGYHVEEVLKHASKEQEVYILVTDLAAFKAAVYLRDLELVFSDDRVKIIGGNSVKELADGIKECLEHFSDESKLIIHYPSLKSMSAEYLEIKDILERIDTYKKSFENHHDITSGNIIKNLPIIEVDNGIIQLKNRFKGKSAFIISAGPSLEKNIDELKKVGNKGIIISVGTAVKKLLAKGIKPDYIVAIDGLLNIKMQLEGIERQDIPLIYFPTINHEALSLYKGKRYSAFPDGDNYFEELNSKQEKGILRSGGSVATVAIDFGKYIGCNPIIFVGQDLALSDTGHTHVSGTLKEGYKNTLKNLREIDGINGGKVKTVKNLYIYLRWIESYIKDNQSIQFINATEGGAKISGTEVMKLETAIDKFCKTSSVNT